VRPILRWLGTRYGVALVLVVLIVGIVATARTFVDGGSRNEVGPLLDPVTTAPAASPTLGDDSEFEPSSAPPESPQLSPNAAPPATVANQFVTAWLKHTGVTAAQWRAALTPHATAALMSKLKDTDPAGVPAQRVTGDVRVEMRSPSLAEVTIPVDSGMVRLRLVPNAGRWKVDFLDWGRS
jgi:hypothetical protein